MVNKNRLFLASCFALITTAMAFSIRAGVLGQLGTEFLSGDPEVNTKLGYINQMAFLGFPIAMIFGGPLYNFIGPKKIMWVAFFTHILGLVMTIFATGFWTLLISTFLVGVGNGTVEAAANPMISDMYEGNEKTKMLNRFHMWFPGGIVVGSLLSQFLTFTGNGAWQIQIGMILIPALIYAYLIMGQEFPASKDEDAVSTGTNFKTMLTSPLYLFMLVCMALTAISEFGPQQWIGPIMKNAGAEPMLILALVTGLMAVGRYFAGPIVHRLNQTGVLLGSAIFACVGIVLMSQATGGMIYVAAIIFAIGVCYFWPTMLGFVAENLPRTGALGLSIMGGMGMFATSIFQPIIGGWLDAEKANAATTGLMGEAAELAAGQATLDNIAVFPSILIVLFGILYFWMKKKNTVA